MDLDRYTLVILRRAPNPTPMTDAELDTLQEDHLAYLRAMRARGHMLAAGPLAEQPDPSMRGICLYRTTIEEARELASRDPSVVAGRLAVDVMSWYTPAGELAFPLAVEDGLT